MNPVDVSKNVTGLLHSMRTEYANYKKEQIAKAEANRFNSLDNWNQFKERAVDIAKQEGFPVSVLLGQAALESGRGSSDFARNRNNYFGIGAYDANPNLAFAYDSIDDNIRGYINLIKHDPRYSRAWANRFNPRLMITEIKRAGYATDRNYVGKVMSMAEFSEYLEN